MLVKQVALSPIESPSRQTSITILWHTGAKTELMVQRPTTGEKLSTSVEVIEAIRELTASRSYAEMAELLNQRGFLTGKGRKFTPSAVNWICWKFQIKKPSSENSQGIRADGCYSTKALAEKLGVSIHTIHYWREKGVLEAHQEYKRGPWWYLVTPEVLQTLASKIHRVPVQLD